MKRFLLITFAITVAAVLHAQPAKAPQPDQPDHAGKDDWSLSVEEAVMQALQNNRELNIRRLEPVIAGAFEQIERGVYDPELFARFEYQEETASETARATGGQFAVEGNDAEGAVGLRQRAPTGTELELSASSARSISNRAPEQQQIRFGLTVTQQLLRGFGMAVNLASLRQAKLETQASRQELAGYSQALVAEVETAYWNFFAANEAITVFEQSLELARTQLDEIETRIEVGSLSKNEAAAARAELALQRQNLIDARSERTARLYELMRLIYPDLPVAEALPLQASSRPGRAEAPGVDPAEHIQLALQSRPELAEAELLRQRDVLETVVTRNGRLPRLELFINIGKSGYADSFRQSFRESDGENYDLTAGFEFSQPLGNRAARGRDIIARTTLEQSEEALANLRSLIRYDVLLAVNELERAHQQIAASAATREFRQQSLQAEMDRFEVGAGTSFDVARAQRDLVQTRINEIQARVAYLIAKVELYRADGSLLHRRGIRLEE